MLSFLRSLWAKAIVWTWLAFGLRAFGFIAVLPLVLKQLPSQEVGLWYVFTSIAGICSMVELGFGAVIARYCSYYNGGYQGLPKLDAFEVSNQNTEPFLPGVAGLMTMARKLYRVFAIILCVAMLLGGGGWLFWKYPEAMKQPANALAFLVFTAGTVWIIAGNFWSNLLFGLNRVRECQRIQIESMLLNYAIVLLGLFLHLGIFSMILGQISMNVYQRFKSRVLFHRHFPIHEGQEVLPIRWQQLWPMTWRSGVLYYAGSFPLGFSTLICAQVFNLEITARYALSLQLVNMASGISNGWIFVKYPFISAYYAQGKLEELRKLVFQRLALQLATFFVISLGAWLMAPMLLAMLRTKTGFLAPAHLALLMLVGGFDLVVQSFSSIVQNGNRYPFIWSQVINAMLTVVLAYAFGKYWGLTGMIAAPLISQLLYNAWRVIGWSWRDLQKKGDLS